MNIFIIFAILSPFFFASTSVFDKYLLEKRMKNFHSYWFLVGCVTILYSVILSVFLDWKTITFTDCVFPIIIGAILFVQTYFYFSIIQKEDIAPSTGLWYMYPLVVAGLSYIFLHEVISWYGYIGIVLTILGAVLISLRLKKISFQSKVWHIIAFIFLIGLGEFIMKVAVGHISSWNAYAITAFVEGTLTFLLILKKETRMHVKSEFSNIHLILSTEVFTFLAISTLYLAMSGLPASVVAGIATVQVLFIVILERLVDQFIGKISRDHYLLPKLIPMILIFIGLILLII
jgi:uncharacterized membrane protein